MNVRSIACAALLAVGLAACGGSGSRVIIPTEPGRGTTPPDNGGTTPPVVRPPTLAVTKIMAFGDSLTEGESRGQLLVPTTHDHGTAGVSTSYPAKLLATLTSTYTDQAAVLKVLNAGVGGEKAVGSQAKDRLIAELALYQPEVLLLLHGVNNVNAPGDSIGTIVEAIEELIEVAHQRRPGIRVILANLPPQIPTAKATGGARITAFNQQLPAVAAEEGADFVDVFSNIDTQTMLMPDGLHLNEAGNVKLAALFYAKIKERFHREPAS